MAGDAAPLVKTIHSLVPGAASAADMRAWKALVAQAASTGAPLVLEFHGGANAITAYRLFYMLLYAKDAGVTRVSLHTDGRFLDDESTRWLDEWRVDEIVFTTQPALAT